MLAKYLVGSQLLAAWVMLAGGMQWGTPQSGQLFGVALFLGLTAVAMHLVATSGK